MFVEGITFYIKTIFQIQNKWSREMPAGLREPYLAIRLHHFFRLPGKSSKKRFS